MAKNRDKYQLGDANCFEIRNRNEVRVLKAVEAYLGQNPQIRFSPKDIQDSYALALNMLPPRYAQIGTIVLRDPVRDNDIDEAVSKAIARVISIPKS